MKITINWSDYTYKTYDFEIVTDLPKEDQRIVDEDNGIFEICDNINNITNLSATSDFGDGGYYELYEVRYITGTMEDGEEKENDDYSFKHFAKWVNYEEDP